MDDKCGHLYLALDDLFDTKRIDITKRGKGGTGVILIQCHPYPSL